MRDSTDGLARVLLPTGVLVKDSLRAEPRFGLVAPIPRLHTERLPSELARTVEVTRPYSAANFNPPAVQGTWREEIVVNSRPPYVSTFNTSVTPRLLTLTSPQGRVGV